jgi:hypothetical protein
MEKLQTGAIKSDNTPYTPDEIKTHNEFIDLVKTAANEQMAGMITKEEAETAIKQAVEATESKMKPTIDKVYDAVLKQGIEMQAMKLQTTNDAKGVDIEKQLFEQKDQLIQLIKSNSGGSHNFILKTNYTTASVTSNPMGMFLPDYGVMGAPKLNIYGSLPKIPIDPESNGVVRYIDQTLATRNAAAASEGSALAESAYAWQGYTLSLQKIGTTLPITEESLKYTARLAAEVELFLQTDVACAIETELATGSGSTPHLNGIYTAATTYSAPAAGITDASIYDLIVKMCEDITSSIVYGGKYTPNVVYMNVSDINKMKLKKDKNFNYVLPPFASKDGTMISGVTVIESPYITANTCVLGDSRYARIYEQPGYEMGYGYNLSGDYAKDILTMKAKKFMGLLIRTADLTGWRKSTDIATDIQTLTGIVTP